jgi:tetratricopeptide (TPR) repeat protein
MFVHNQVDWHLERLDERTRIAPEDPTARLEFARTLISKGIYHGGGEQCCTRAVRELQRALREDPNCAEAHVLAAIALIQIGRNEPSRRHLDEAWRIAPERADLHLAEGILSRASGDRERAVKHLEDACRLAPDAWEPQLHLGQALLGLARDLGNPKRMLERAQLHLVRVLGADPPHDIVPKLTRDLGRACLLTGRFREAEKLFLRLRQDPRYNARARFHLGEVAYALGKYKNAIHHFRQYLADQPQDARVYSTVAMAYLQLGELARAREACNQALLIDPDQVEAQYTLGCALLEEGDPNEALRVFRHLLRNHPDHLPTYVEVVRTRRLSGDVQWLNNALHAEVAAVDQLPLGTGRIDPRAETRKRIQVLLEELRALGPTSAEPIVQAIHRTQDESVRFDLWETACSLASGIAAQELSRQLENPGDHFSAALGRQALFAASLLPEPILVRGLSIDEQDLKRAAANRYGTSAPIEEHRARIHHLRIEARVFQAALLLAIARRGSRSGKALLQRWAETADAELATAARIGLALTGEPNATQHILALARERGASNLVQQLLQTTTPPSTPALASDIAPQVDAHCTACGRTSQESQQLMAGSQAVLCAVCVREIDNSRVASGEQCMLCGQDAFAAVETYRHADVVICCSCLDQSVGLIERQEIDQVLARW